MVRATYEGLKSMCIKSLCDKKRIAYPKICFYLTGDHVCPNMGTYLLDANVTNQRMFNRTPLGSDLGLIAKNQQMAKLFAKVIQLGIFHHSVEFIQVGITAIKPLVFCNRINSIFGKL